MNRGEVGAGGGSIAKSRTTKLAEEQENKMNGIEGRHTCFLNYNSPAWACHETLGGITELESMPP